MNINALRYFHEVTLTLSIRRAADRLHISPSSVSRKLAELETSFGVPLLERRADGVALTEAGEILASRAKEILVEIEDVTASIDEIRGLKRGNVRIATVEGMIENFLPLVLTRFKERYPDIRFTVSALATEKAVSSVEKYEADIAFIYDFGGNEFIEELATYHQPLLPFVPPTHPLRHERNISVRRLLSHAYCLPDKSYKINRLIERIKRVDKITREPEIVSSSLAFLNEYAVLNECIVFVPVQAVQSRVLRGQLVPLDVSSKVFETRQLALVSRRNRPLPLAVRAFTQFAQDEFRHWEEKDREIMAMAAP